VLVRTRRDPWCNTSRCNSTITWFIWDGDQILSEIRTEGGASFVEGNTVGGPQFGRVVYTHGPGIDKPLDIIHMDNMSGGAGTILPIATWRGSFVQATDPQGNPLCPPPGSSAAPCIVTFPGSYSSTFYNAGLPVERVSWFGSLAEGNVDGSGTIYMRNRYYNPQTGSFTQQDPIGLAGGLNTYGFANGDPVSYSDPYGLIADSVKVGVRPLSGIAGAAGAHAAIRVQRDDGSDLVLELLNNEGKNFVGYWPAKRGARSPSGEEYSANDYRWFTVATPEGMTDEEFATSVVNSFNVVAAERQGKKYFWGGPANSNQFVWEVINRAGGEVPVNVRSGIRLIPGICGGAFSIMGPSTVFQRGHDCHE
jgi:RHS repeat-associated protein